MIFLSKLAYFLIELYEKGKYNFEQIYKFEIYHIMIYVQYPT